MTGLALLPEPHPVSVILDTSGVAVIARVLLTSPFWISGRFKLIDFQSALREAAHFGLRLAAVVAVAVIFVQIGGSLAVISNRAVWLGAGALGVCTFWPAVSDTPSGRSPTRWRGSMR